MASDKDEVALGILKDPVQGGRRRPLESRAAFF